MQFPAPQPAPFLRWFEPQGNRKHLIHPLQFFRGQIREPLNDPDKRITATVFDCEFPNSEKVSEMNLEHGR